MQSGKRLVYVCEGGDCSEKGSIDLHAELGEMLPAFLGALGGGRFLRIGGRDPAGPLGIEIDE